MKVINFSRSGLIFLCITLTAIVAAGFLTYYQDGFNLGIDFSSGVSLQVQINNREANAENIRELLLQYGTVNVQRSRAGAGRYIIKISEDNRGSNFQSALSQQTITTLEAQYGTDSVQLLESAFIGPRFSASIVRQFFLLTFGAFLLIMAYVWFRFKFSYALAALAALLHDVLFMIGFVGALQIEISTTTIAAILTIIGYSLNDTIVIFDRIRENYSLLHEADLNTIINTSITQSLSRTIMTSLTTLLAVAAIYIFSSGAIQYFALNMMVGVVVGTFSSIFIASALLLKLLRRATTSLKKEQESPKAGAKTAQISERSGESSAEQSALSQARIEREIEARKKMRAAKQSQRKKRR